MEPKTRESLRTIKIFDRAESLAGKTKGGLSEVNRQAEDVQGSNYDSATDYAGSQVQGTEKSMARKMAYGADKIGRWGVRETSRIIQNRRHRPPRVKKLQVKTLPQSERSALPPGKKAVKTSQKSAKTTRKTTKTVKRSAKSIQATAKKTVEIVQKIAKTIVKAVKTTVLEIKDLIAVISAGGWIAVLIIVILCLIGGLVIGISSIFKPNEDGRYSVSYMLSVCENEALIYEQNIIEKMPHDEVEIIGEGPSVKDIVAVYAVHCNLAGNDFSKADSEAQELFRQVFNVMYTILYYTVEREETTTKQCTDTNGNIYYIEETIIINVLHIERKTMSANEAVDRFSFDQKQREYLDTLMSREFDEMWAVPVN